MRGRDWFWLFAGAMIGILIGMVAVGMTVGPC